MATQTQPTVDFSIINPKNELMIAKQQYEIKQEVMKELAKLPYDVNLKYSNEFVKYVMRLVHFIVPKTFKDDEKRSLVLDIINTFIPLTETEKMFIIDTVNFLIKNKIIQPVKWRKIIFKSVGNFLSKKFS